MKPKINKVFLVGFMMLFVLNCTKDTQQTQQPTNLNLSISLTAKSDCKLNKSAQINECIAAINQSCIDYSFDQTTKKLTLKHINAGFNCCPGNISCTVTFRSDTIIIQEFEEKASCKCNCTYDLNLIIDGVELGKYQLRMIEPYSGNQEKLNFELDLVNQTQGSWCATRNEYPWGQ